MVDGYFPHAVTVLFWSVNGIAVWYGLRKINMIKALGLWFCFMCINVMLFPDLTSIIERQIKYIDVGYITTNGTGYPTSFFLMFVLGWLLWTYNYISETKFMVKPNKLTMLFLFGWVVSMTYFSATNYWWRWDAYIIHSIGVPPQDWGFLLNRFCGASVYTTLVYNRKW